MSREVMERDLRAPAYREGAPNEYEFRSDGAIVRKDRFQTGMRDIAAIVFGCGNDYEIADVIKAIHMLKSTRLIEAMAMARDVFESSPKALECIDYLQAVLDNPKEKS